MIKDGVGRLSWIIWVGAMLSQESLEGRQEVKEGVTMMETEVRMSERGHKPKTVGSLQS